MGEEYQCQYNQYPGHVRRDRKQCHNQNGEPYHTSKGRAPEGDPFPSAVFTDEIRYGQLEDGDKKGYGGDEADHEFIHLEIEGKPRQKDAARESREDIGEHAVKDRISQVCLQGSSHRAFSGSVSVFRSNSNLNET